MSITGVCRVLRIETRLTKYGLDLLRLFKSKILSEFKVFFWIENQAGSFISEARRQYEESCNVEKSPVPALYS